MKILMFKAWEKSNVDGNWNHYLSELEKHGHKVKVMSLYDFDDDTDIANKAILEELKKDDYQLFFTWHQHIYVYIDTVLKIKEMGIKTLLICGDNLVVPYNHKECCKYYDLVWLTSRETMHLFKKWGANCIFMPYACNTDNFYYIEQEKYIDRVCFVGTAYGSRINMINNLIKNGVKVDLYEAPSLPEAKMEVKPAIIKAILTYLKFKEGRKIFVSGILNKFIKPEELDENNPNLNRIISYTHLEQMREIYSKYKLCLSSSTAYNTWILKNPLYIVNLRSFEVPSCGGVQFVQRTKELEEYFTDGKDIIFYNDKNDMAEIAKKYLAMPDEEIRKIKIVARQNIIDNHTWIKRFNYCFKLLGLDYEK